MSMTTPAAAHGPALAAAVARLFFDRQMTKVEIASHLGISRFRVARLLEGALRDGLVRIEYRDTPADDRALATAVETRFGLDLCAVAAVADASAPRLAAAVLDGLIAPAEVIGVAWGSTLAAVVRAVTPRVLPDVTVVQLAGSSASLGRDRDPGELSRGLADRLGATHHGIYAPAFVASARLRDSLIRQPEVADAFARFPDVTLALVGIGAMPRAEGEAASSSLLRSGTLGVEDVGRLVAAGAVGDLVVHAFDRTGRFVAPELGARSIAIGVAELRAVRRVMAVATGTAKVAAIRGALATGLVGILVTDAPTARQLLAAD